MKVTQMPPIHAANLVANSGNTAYGNDAIHPTLYIEYNYLFMLGLKLIHASKKGHWCLPCCQCTETCSPVSSTQH